MLWEKHRKCVSDVALLYAEWKLFRGIQVSSTDFYISTIRTPDNGRYKLSMSTVCIKFSETEFFKICLFMCLYITLNLSFLFQSNTILVWYQIHLGSMVTEFLSIYLRVFPLLPKSNNLHIFVWFQVFFSNINNHMVSRNYFYLVIVIYLHTIIWFHITNNDNNSNNDNNNYCYQL